jgi:hypothetical protein
MPVDQVSFPDESHLRFFFCVVKSHIGSNFQRGIGGPGSLF